MKKFLSLTILVFTLSFALPMPSFAHGMMENGMMGGGETTVQSDDGHTVREEAEGKAIWEKLQDKELTCEDLTDDDFGALGEYFMGQMTGEQHEAMNNMMIQMMGKEGEKQMHIAMGKRMSGCDPAAPMPQNMTDGGMMPMMMNMMMGGGMMGNGNSMMDNFASNPMSWFSLIFIWLIALTWIVWFIVGILAAIWLWRQIKKK